MTSHIDNEVGGKPYAVIFGATSLVGRYLLRRLAQSGFTGLCLSRKTDLTMVFKLCQSASKKWRRLDGSHHLAEIIRGVKFKDGEKLTQRAA